MEGLKKKIDEVLNIEILIIAYRLNKSKFSDGDYLSLQIELGGEKFVVFTGSTVLADQVEKYADKMPFLARIVKIDRYYSLS